MIRIFVLYVLDPLGRLRLLINPPVFRRAACLPVCLRACGCSLAHSFLNVTDVDVDKVRDSRWLSGGDDQQHGSRVHVLRHPPQEVQEDEEDVRQRDGAGEAHSRVSRGDRGGAEGRYVLLSAEHEERRGISFFSYRTAVFKAILPAKMTPHGGFVPARFFLFLVSHQDYCLY